MDEAFITGNPDCFDLTDISGDMNRTHATSLALSNNEIFGVSGTLTYDFDRGTLRSISAYRTLEARFQQDSDHTPFPVFDTINARAHRQFSQEITLAGASEGFA